jgi:hypothetical protein
MSPICGLRLRVRLSPWRTTGALIGSLCPETMRPTTTIAWSLSCGCVEPGSSAPAAAGAAGAVSLWACALVAGRTAMTVLVRRSGASRRIEFMARRVNVMIYYIKSGMLQCDEARQLQA